jgi:hypothetical protein
MSGLRRVIDLIQVNAKAAELGPVLETIENALRSDRAKMIKAGRVGPPDAIFLEHQVALDAERLSR